MTAGLAKRQTQRETVDGKLQTMVHFGQFKVFLNRFGYKAETMEKKFGSNYIHFI